MLKYRLIRMGAPKGLIDWVHNKSLKEVWDTCPNSDWLIWIVARSYGETSHTVKMLDNAHLKHMMLLGLVLSLISSCMVIFLRVNVILLCAASFLTARLLHAKIDKRICALIRRHVSFDEIEKPFLDALNK